MRIGVVSDTHNNLKNVREIIALFNDVAVERVIHTGDISQAKVMEAFSKLQAPLFGVYGNNDQGELASLEAAAIEKGFHFIQPPLALEWAGRRIVVVHDPLELEPIDTDPYDVILHGHTHRQRIEIVQDQLIFNPGECAGMMKGFNAVGVLDLAAMEPEILNF
jgi:putative phosphoesterase